MRGLQASVWSEIHFIVVRCLWDSIKCYFLFAFAQPCRTCLDIGKSSPLIARTKEGLADISWLVCKYESYCSALQNICLIATVCEPQNRVKINETNQRSNDAMSTFERVPQLGLWGCHHLPTQNQQVCSVWVSALKISRCILMFSFWVPFH